MVLCGLMPLDRPQPAGRIAVLAEKPSVARDIARVLGAGERGEGFLHGNGYIVTWAIGHLVTLAQPHEIDPAWKQWRRETLPMLPAAWPLVVLDQTKNQFEVVRRILTSPRVDGVVCATDAGREGELIFRYIYEAAGCVKPFRRLWISSLTPEAIRRGFDTLRDGHEYDPLADAARGRSRADWLVGMNLSRAYSLAFNERDFSVGRVQTPTLAMVVERELAIRAFVPEDYFEVVATFSEAYQGTWFREKPSETRLPVDGEEANRIVERARTGEARVASVEAETQRMAPPLLYDLTELQRHANRLYGFSAQKTLEIAQNLYEKHKLLSYPRTDSRHLSKDVAQTLPRIVQVIRGPYERNLAPGTGERPLGRRFVDDAKVTDHHAIIPTTVSAGNASLDDSERKIYDLVCRRLLSAWHDDHIWNVTTVITAITNGGVVDRYHTSGTAVEQVGWKALDIVLERKKEDQPPSLPPGLAAGLPQKVTKVEAVKKRTRPPKRLTEATLLTAMESAGKALDDKELSDAMKESGLGTPATRAAIIEVLLKRNYIERQGKSLVATDKGVRLIEVVHPEVKSPVMTGQWEAQLQRIHRGSGQLEPFLRGIEDYVREVVGRVRTGVMGRGPGAGEARPQLPAPTKLPATLQAAPSSLEDLLHTAFGFASFRPNQEAVCRAAVEGRDCLLVMPTGAGKSLCYQLPGLARGGTTLVISPLIALMEDQVAKLKERGFAVERIHSGRDRAASRQVCLDYLAGKLQFLFIAPERLRVTGFPEMLAKRRPTLIAIDEAHCISQWGHDFRPDYRMIGQHLPLLRPAPVMALTATATPIVQNDIVEQLGLPETVRFIHGFRRSNIAVEVVEVPPSMRAELARDILLQQGCRPAIVYVPTRKQADALATNLASSFPAAAYHAGLMAERRRDVQARFLEARLDVIIATIAFGMGIDKPDVRTVIHTALPGSLEAYYQEIGRAGRDGLPSRAVLMHSYADRHTHDFFFERDYPDVGVLESIFNRLGEAPVAKEEIQRRVRMDAESFDKALEKLWIHGGAVVDFAENIARGTGDWRPSYQAQSEQKAAQLEQMLRYTETGQCRMCALVGHFGDSGDSRAKCGICDFCAPGDCIAQDYRGANEAEMATARAALAALRRGEAPSSGKLHAQVVPHGELTRDEFEQLLGSMARAGLVQLTDKWFEKDGRRIDYRSVSVTREGFETEEPPALEIRTVAQRAPSKKKKRKKGAKAPVEAKPRAAGGRKMPVEAKPVAVTAPDERIGRALRAWRLSEAKRQNVPAFRILSDRTLDAIAASRPETANELLSVPGVGLKVVERYGNQIFRLLHGGV